MRILVYGAGVLGSQYAAALHQAGRDVTLLARGERLEQVRRHGIVLEDAGTGQKMVAHVAVVDRLLPDEPYDLALVMVRSSQVAAVLPALAANPHIPSVVFLGNNIHGAGALEAALGRERVLLGFAAAGGVRTGHIIRCPAGRRGATYVGELDGGMTLRLAEIKDAFAGTAFPVKIFNHIEDWLKTHVAVISPLAYAIYMSGGDNYRLARTRDALVLAVRAIREAFKALKSGGIAITPASLERFSRLPEPLLVMVFRRLLDTQAAEVAIAGHANAARDEMEHLAGGLWALVEASGVPAPALGSLYRYRSPAEPPVEAGSRAIPMRGRELWIGLGALAVAAGGLLWLTRRKKRE